MNIAEIIGELKPEYVYTVRQISYLLDNTHHDRRTRKTIAGHMLKAWRAGRFTRSRIARKGSPYGYILVEE